MEYLKICEVAKRWGFSERGVQALCAQGKIEGHPEGRGSLQGSEYLWQDL